MPSNPLHRRLAVGVLSIGLLAGVLIPLTGASAASCASWTDKKGDATTDQSGQAVLADAQLDILSAALGTVGDSLVATITTDGLSSSSSDGGDEFRMLFSVGTVNMTMYADRFAMGGQTVDTDAGIFDNQGSATPLKPGEATYDVKAKTVTIKVKTADVVAASGGKVAVGSTLTKVTAETTNVIPLANVPATQYDDAPTEMTTVLGTQCEMGGAAAAPAPAASTAGSASPAASAAASPAASSAASPAASSAASPAASPAASASAAPSAQPSGGASASPAAGGANAPAPDCLDIADPKGDANVNPTTNAATGLSNDPDLDILAVNFQTQPETLVAYLKIDKLGAKPASGNGHRFNATFTAGTKTVEVYAGQPDATASAANGVLVGTGQFTPAAGGVRIAGAYNPTVKMSAVFDVTSSRVVLSIDRATLDKALGTPVADGEVVKATLGRSAVYTPSGGNIPADTAQAAKPEEQIYTIGDNRCFAAAAAGPAAGASPAPATASTILTVSAPSRIRTSDPEPVTATLKDSEGNPVSGKRLTAQVGAGSAVAGTTDSAGQVRLLPRVVDRAGTRALVVRFAGNADGSGKTEVRRNITVLEEVSKIATASSSTGSSRTFTITLTDDDPVRNPLAGAKVTLKFNGRTVTLTTDRNGRAKLSMRNGQRVDIRYDGRPGFVLPGTARTIVGS